MTALSGNESPAGPAGPVVLRLASGASPDPRRQTPDENKRPPGFPGGLPFVGVGPLCAAALQKQGEAREGERSRRGFGNGDPAAAVERSETAGDFSRILCFPEVVVLFFPDFYLTFSGDFD